MTILRAMIAATAVAFSIGSAAVAAAPEIAVGKPLPANFSAKDATGRVRTLGNLSGRRGMVLVMFRSARWCPYCQVQLKGLKDVQAALTMRGYTLNALSYDPPEALAGFAAKAGIGYTLLSDEKSAMIDALGLRDPAYAAGSFAYGVPRATILVVDAKRVVRWKSVATDYKIRPANAEILAAVDALPQR